MIPDPMVRLREMAPEWAEWIGADVRGSAWFQHFPSWLTDSGSASPRPFWALQLDRGQVKVWGAPESRNTPHPFALNLRTGAAKFPDGTTIPEAVWMRYYRARPVVMNRARAEEIARGHATRGGNSFEMDIERAADAIMEAVAEEREACAKLADEISFGPYELSGGEIGEAIRSRNEQPAAAKDSQ